MSSITTGGKTTTYAYDADGIRTTKVVGGVTHEYLTLSGKVVYEKIGTGSTAKIMVFTYDAQGRPFAVKYSKNNGDSFTNYFYALNLQGDVVKIFRPVSVKDADGNITGYTEKTYATYSYNAWGELTGITDSNGNSILNKQTTSTALANLNPLRYRGYYYDNDTGFYYLQSRYYDPANHRFLNADIFTSTDSTNAIACNMFAYCRNNCGNLSDSSGMRPVTVLGLEEYTPKYHHFQKEETIIDVTSEGNKPRSGEIFMRIAQAAYSSIDASVGVGLGLYGEADIFDVAGIGFGVSYNLLEVRLSEGSFSIGQSYFMGLSLSAGFFDVLPEAHEIGYRDLTFSSSIEDFTPSEANSNWTFFSAGAYLFAGGSVYVGFDMTGFFQKVHEICFE